MNHQIIRVKPESFDGDWRQDLKDMGYGIATDLQVLQYSPVNHKPLPFSIEIDLTFKKAVKKITGVMPNATYRGHIYTWDEFMKLTDTEDGRYAKR